MSSKRKQKTDKKRQENNHSVTKTLQKSENRQVGKAGKILTVDFTGRPSFGRIEKLEGWFSTTVHLHLQQPLVLSLHDSNKLHRLMVLHVLFIDYTSLAMRYH